jgi:hypothetical protein
MAVPFNPIDIDVEIGTTDTTFYTAFHLTGTTVAQLAVCFVTNITGVDRHIDVWKLVGGTKYYLAKAMLVPGDGVALRLRGLVTLRTAGTSIGAVADATGVQLCCTFYENGVP